MGEVYVCRCSTVLSYQNQVWGDVGELMASLLDSG